MKKIVYFLLIIFTVTFFFSCSKDEIFSEQELEVVNSKNSLKSGASCSAHIKNARKFLTGHDGQGKYWSMKYYNVDSVTGETLGFVILPPIFPPVLDTICGNTGLFKSEFVADTNLIEWIGSDTSLAPFNKGRFEFVECTEKGIRLHIETQFPIQNNELFIEKITPHSFSILFYIPVGPGGSVVPVRILGESYDPNC